MSLTLNSTIGDLVLAIGEIIVFCSEYCGYEYYGISRL